MWSTRLIECVSIWSPILISLISNIEPDVVYLVVGCVSICFILISPISI